MNRKKNIVLGLIGLGNWGPKLLRNFIDSGFCRVRQVCDLQPSNFRKLGLAKEGAAYTNDYRDLIRDSEIEAVAVATSSETHYRIGREVLLGGKHLFMEKPLALSSRDAAKLVELARREKKIIMVGHLLMYHPAVVALAEQVRRGRIGRVFFLGIRRRALGRVQSGCSVLWDLGPHDISLALMVAGKQPRRVVTTGQSYLQEGVPEVAFTTITFEDGTLAHLEESWLSPVRERQLMVVGEKGMLVFDELAADGIPLKLIRKSVRLRRRTKIKMFEYLDAGTDPVEVAAEQPLAMECRHFLDCIRKGREPLSNGENGLQVLRVLEAADRSLSGGGKVVAIRGAGGK